MGRFDLEAKHNMSNLKEVCVKATGNMSALQVFFNSTKSLYNAVLKNKAFKASGNEYFNVQQILTGEFIFGADILNANSSVEGLYNELVELFNENAAVEGVSVKPVPFLKNQKESSIDYEAIQKAATVKELQEQFAIAFAQMSDIGGAIIDNASELDRVWGDSNYDIYRTEVQKEIAANLKNLGSVNFILRRASDNQPDKK